VLGLVIVRGACVGVGADDETGSWWTGSGARAGLVDDAVWRTLGDFARELREPYRRYVVIVLAKFDGERLVLEGWVRG
jgi:hypothetical protein